MNSERDFKGVWIPKEIWLSNELTLLEKCIFTEISSLDNENHCTAGNEYFAEFCDCSESKVSKSIKKLQDLGMIEIMAFDGRHRKIRVVKSTTQSSKKSESESYFLHSNNINSNTENSKISISKDIDIARFEFGKSKKPEQNMYSKCLLHIREFTDNSDVLECLKDFLASLSQMNKLKGEKQFIGILNKLKSITEDPDKQITVIKNSIEHGYGTFYDCLQDNRPHYRKDKQSSTDMGHTSERAKKGGLSYEKF